MPTPFVFSSKKRAKPGQSHSACSRATDSALPGISAADCSAAIAEHHVDQGASSATSYYNLFLSYSANFASGYQPNPPGSGYHWTLLPSRLKMSPAFAAKVATRRARAGQL